MELEAIAGPLNGYVMLMFQGEGQDESLELVMTEDELRTCAKMIAAYFAQRWVGPGTGPDGASLDAS